MSLDTRGLRISFFFSCSVRALFIVYKRIYYSSFCFFQCFIILGELESPRVPRTKRKMRENIPEFGMVDVEWLNIPTTSRKQRPQCIQKFYPIVDELVDPFVKQNRTQVTLIACSDVAKAAISIPYIIGPIAAANSENFKMIMAQKIYTQYTIGLHHEISNSCEDEPNPIKLSSGHNDRDSNLKVVTLPKAFNFIEEALFLSKSYLTHLVIEGFDGENSLDMELLFRTIQLAEMQEQFRVILLSDGLVHSSQNRVAKLCDGVVSFKSSSLLDTTIELPNRDIYVFDPASDKIIQLKDHDYETTTCSRITDVNMETEPSLTLVQLNKQVKDTAWLINHFIDQEISSSNRNSSFTFVVFTASNKVMRMLKNEIYKITDNADAEISCVRFNNDIKYVREKKGRVVVLVSDMAEDAFILDNVSIVIDMGLTSWKSNVTSIGSNHIRTIWADRIRRIRRAKIVEKGIVAYPFDNKMLQCITSRSISKFPGYDLEMRYFHDSKHWSYRLNEERTNELMRRAENILCTAGLISYKDRRYCTPLGSFCNSVLPMLSPRMAKLVLCGIVCGCEDAAVALATILTEEAVAIDCSKNMYRLLGMVKVQIRSEHLACLHAYDSRFGPTKSLFPNYGTIQNMEKKEQLIRMRIQKDGKAGVGVFENDEETEKRLLLALAMAFGDRIGYASKGDEKGETRLFSINDPDNGDTQFQMQSSIKFPASDEEAGVYHEMRERDTEFHSWSTAEVTMLPVTILGAIGNIGGRAVKSTEGLYLTTNTGPLHVKMMEYDDVDEMLDIRNEVMMEVQRVALTYLNTDRYSIIFKKERDNWMNELIPLLTPHSPS